MLDELDEVAVFLGQGLRLHIGHFLTGATLVLMAAAVLLLTL